MCLILFAYECHERYKLIVAANRDEIYQRPSLALAYWPDSPNILAGRDLEGQGTWLGINTQGRWAALTNFRDPFYQISDPLTRGRLVSGYLRENEPPRQYLAKVSEERRNYRPFNLLVGDLETLYYYSPLKNRLTEIEPGVHGLSNSFLDTPWPKVRKGKRLLADFLKQQVILPQELLELLMDQEVFEDHHLPDTGVGIEWERLLSSIYITSPTYGTRASSVLLVDRNNHVSFIERSFIGNNLEKNEARFEFDICTAK